MVADITAIVGKVSYDLSLKRREIIKPSLKPEFRSKRSAYKEPTELFFGDDLTKHVKDLTMTNKLKRSESYYQSKYSHNKYSKHYAKSYSRQSFLGRGRGSLPKKSSIILPLHLEKIWDFLHYVLSEYQIITEITHEAKLNKVPITTLHFETVPLSGYIDDFLTEEDTFSICEENIHKTMRLYDKLGFDINLKKSQIVPIQRIRILGFVIDSVKMIVTLTREKKQKLKTLVLNLLRINKPTIRYLAKVTGIIISCMLAAILGPLFYRYLEKDKVTSLRLNKGNFDAPAKISSKGKQRLEWWLENADNIEKPIALHLVDLEYFCDSSSYSSGANFDTQKIRGA